MIEDLLKDYGPLGIFTIALVIVVRILWGIIQRQHEANVARIDTLEKNQEKYWTQDRAKMLDTIRDTAAVISRNNDILERLLPKPDNPPN